MYNELNNYNALIYHFLLSLIENYPETPKHIKGTGIVTMIDLYYGDT